MSNQPFGDDTTVIARTVTRIVSPVIFVTAIALLLQGHNLPGGGFIAGVLTAAGFALIYIIFGLDYVQDTLLERDVDAAFGLPRPALAADYRAMFALGLLVAVVAGAVSMAFPQTGYAFLGQTDWLYDVVLEQQLLFEFHFASAFAFDLGVYLVVVGGLLAIVSVVGAE
jgi:multicomponent Na+:H+ antiporter subunit B